MSNEKLKFYVLTKDDKLEIRLPVDLKRQLKKEAKDAKYSALSKYVLAIILNRGK